MTELIQGDCMEQLIRIPDNSVDLILCDPPYGIDYQSAWRIDKAKRKDKIVGDKETQTAFIVHLPRIVKNTGAVMIFTRWDVQQKVIDRMTAAGMKPRNVLIWDKVAHSMGDLRRAYGSRYESIVFWSAPGFAFTSGRPTDILRFARVPAAKLVHPNEKPIELLRELIGRCTNEGDTVLDCYMGSGSTGVAAESLHRNFIGIEIDGKYYDIAKRRIMEGPDVT